MGETESQTNYISRDAFELCERQTAEKGLLASERPAFLIWLLLHSHTLPPSFSLSSSLFTL